MATDSYAVEMDPHNYPKNFYDCHCDLLKLPLEIFYVNLFPLLSCEDLVNFAETSQDHKDLVADYYSNYVTSLTLDNSLCCIHFFHQIKGVIDLTV